MININQLQYFVISAEQGSLSKAAEVLYTTQPHVSKTIKSLEGYLGMELFERTPRGVILSKDGERIYAYAKNILKNAELIDHSKQNKGESLFSIATNPSSKMSELFSQFYNDKKDENIKFKYIEGGVEDIITNSDHAMVKLLKFSELCNIGSCWFRGEYKDNEKKMIPIKGYENYLNFGYIKCKSQELNKYGEEFLKYVMNIIDDGI